MGSPARPSRREGRRCSNRVLRERRRCGDIARPARNGGVAMTYGHHQAEREQGRHVDRPHRSRNAAQRGGDTGLAPAAPAVLSRLEVQCGPAHGHPLESVADPRCSPDWRCSVGVPGEPRRIVATAPAVLSRLEVQCGGQLARREGVSTGPRCSPDWRCSVGPSRPSRGGLDPALPRCSPDWRCSVGPRAATPSIGDPVPRCSPDWMCSVGSLLKTASLRRGRIPRCSPGWMCTVGGRAREVRRGRRQSALLSRIEVQRGPS